MVLLMGFLAFGVDLGYILNTKTELQRATDAAALAGVSGFASGLGDAHQQASDFLTANLVGGRSLKRNEFRIELGRWDPDTRTFLETLIEPSAVRVSAARRDVPLFFAKVFGFQSSEIDAISIASGLPRDIVLTLDLSASMNDESEIRRINELGESVRGEVEAGLFEIWQELGSPRFGNMEFQPRYISTSSRSRIMRSLGLDGVPYPYPEGSWAHYISYVRSGSTLRRAGYRKRYGYLTLVNYWLDRRPTNAQTPDLWKATAQPLAAVKDAVGVFVDMITQVGAGDRVGLVVYNSPSQEALLEQTLTDDFDLVEDIIDQPQAGHYDTATNIGAGIQRAIQELDENAREYAGKNIILMTDGIANTPRNTKHARLFALEQAQLAADKACRITTISLGRDADTDLMQQIADMTGGIHFNIPTGKSIAKMEEALREVFRRIAFDGRTILVK
jgi:hypothetical protein